MTKEGHLCQNKKANDKYCDRHTCWKCYQVIAMEENRIFCLIHKCKVDGCPRIVFHPDGEGDCFKCMLEHGNQEAHQLFSQIFDQTKKF